MRLIMSAVKRQIPIPIFTGNFYNKKACRQWSLKDNPQTGTCTLFLFLLFEKFYIKYFHYRRFCCIYNFATGSTHAHKTYFNLFRSNDILCVCMRNSIVAQQMYLSIIHLHVQLKCMFSVIYRATMLFWTLL